MRKAMRVWVQMLLFYTPPKKVTVFTLFDHLLPLSWKKKTIVSCRVKSCSLLGFGFNASCFEQLNYKVGSCGFGESRRVWLTITSDPNCARVHWSVLWPTPAGWPPDCSLSLSPEQNKSQQPDKPHFGVKCSLAQGRLSGGSGPLRTLCMLQHSLEQEAICFI